VSVTHLLDTTIVSALMRSDRAAAEHLLRADPNDVKVPQPVVAEIRYGLSRLPPSRRRSMLEDRLEVLLQSLERVPWSDEVSRVFGEVKADLEKRGTRVDDFDLAVAAHALVLGATLVTENTKHFRRVRGLSVESWA